MDSQTNAYSRALEEESMAWKVLHGMQRSDPGYLQALSDWQAAADRIKVELEKLSKPSPAAANARLDMAIPAMPLASGRRTGSALIGGRSTPRGQDR